MATEEARKLEDTKTTLESTIKSFNESIRDIARETLAFSETLRGVQETLRVTRDGIIGKVNALWVLASSVKDASTSIDSLKREVENLKNAGIDQLRETEKQISVIELVASLYGVSAEKLRTHAAFKELYNKQLEDSRRIIEQLIDAYKGTLKLTEEQIEALRRLADSHRESIDIIDILKRIFTEFTGVAATGVAILAAVFRELARQFDAVTRAAGDAAAASVAATGSTRMIQGAWDELAQFQSQSLYVTNIQLLRTYQNLASAVGLFDQRATGTFDSLDRLLWAFQALGVSSEDAARLINQSYRRTAMSVDEMAGVLAVAHERISELRLSTVSAYEMMVAMSASLARVGADANVAARIVEDLGDAAEAVGKTPPEVIENFARSFADFLGALSPSTVAGWTMFLQQTMQIPTEAELLEVARDPYKLLSEVIARVRDMTGDLFEQNRLIFYEGISRALGIHVAGGMRGIQLLAELVERGASRQEIENVLIRERAAGIETIASVGVDVLKEQLGIFRRMEKVWEKIAQGVAPEAVPVIAGPVGGFFAGAARGAAAVLPIAAPFFAIPKTAPLAALTVATAGIISGIITTLFSGTGLE